MPGAQECKIQASRVPPTTDASSPLRLRRPTPLVASSVPHAARRQVRCGVPLCQRPAAQHVASPAGLLAAQQAASPPRHAAAHSSCPPSAPPPRIDGEPPELSRGQRRWHPLGKLLPVRARGAGPRPRAFVVFSSRRRHHQRLLKVLARAKIF
jgi:hypothetical protein